METHSQIFDEIQPIQAQPTFANLTKNLSNTNVKDTNVEKNIDHLLGRKKHFWNPMSIDLCNRSYHHQIIGWKAKHIKMLLKT